VENMILFTSLEFTYALAVAKNYLAPRQNTARGAAGLRSLMHSKVVM
jgi:hypothetical protein